jgi:hypothetical protein
VCFLLLGLLFVFGGLTEDGIWRILQLAVGGFLLLGNIFELLKLMRQRHHS